MYIIYKYHESIKKCTGKIKGQTLILVLIQFSLSFIKQTHIYKDIQVQNYPNIILRCLLKSEKIRSEEKRQNRQRSEIYGT